MTDPKPSERAIQIAKNLNHFGYVRKGDISPVSYEISSAGLADLESDYAAARRLIDFAGLNNLNVELEQTRARLEATNENLCHAQQEAADEKMVREAAERALQAAVERLEAAERNLQTAASHIDALAAQVRDYKRERDEAQGRLGEIYEAAAHLAGKWPEAIDCFKEIQRLATEEGKGDGTS
jgi:chromosome segregation ATPase